MKRINKILTLAAICCTSAFVASCSKDDAVAGDQTPKFTKVEMSLDTRADTSQQQGDKITDVNIWAFEVAADGSVAEQPSGWGTRTYDVYQETPADAPVYFELPYSESAKEYRFVALVNQSAFGKIYKPSSTTAQTFSPQSTYSELTRAIFAAEMMNINPSTVDAMPVSHWQDFTIGNGTTDGKFTASSTDVPAKFVGKMVVYRALAKTQLSAKLSAESSSNAVLKITNVAITAAKGVAVPNQGFVFSSIADLSGTVSGTENPTPLAFGDYADISKAIPSITLQGINGAPAITSAEIQVVGSSFLYENHRGMVYNSSVSTTSPDNYDEGAYYMKIEYEYGQSDNNGGIDATSRQTGTNYVPLPLIVRNRLYQVNATFDVNTDGKVTLTYTVADWENGGDSEIVFSYPTFSIEAVTPDDYSKPTAYYDSANNEKGAFQFKFYPSAPLPKEYIVTLSNREKFDVAIYRNGSTKIDRESFTDTNAEDYYIIKVYPNGAMPTDGDAPTTKIAITHEASWTGAYEKLLINTSSGGTLWSDSGGDRHSILITQVAQN